MTTRRTKAAPLTKAYNPALLTVAKSEDFLEAIAVLGFVDHACKLVGIDHKTITKLENADPLFKQKVATARAEGLAKRLEAVESVLYTMLPTTPVIAMFLAKKLDPSYRESYNVVNTQTPTNYVIDLSLPTGDDTPHDADQAPSKILG